MFIAGGSQRPVCELCTARAAHDGWIREGADPLPAVHPRGGERARSLVGRLRARRENGGGQPHLPPADQDGATVPLMSEPRRVHAVPTNAEMRVARALELFNRSEHTRTIAGVARSLGAPAVAVRALAQSGALVEIVVAWELCWYRYEVDLAEEPEAVQLLDQGDELAELGELAAAPNAVADERGELTLNAARG
jgi:hypothetical protein